MKLFDQNSPGLEINLTNVIIATVVTIVLFQAFGLIFGPALGLNIYLGPVFILLPLAIAGIMGVAIAKKLIENTPTTRKDIFAIVIVTLVALLTMFFLRGLVPEVFQQSMVAMQSMLGFA